MLSFRNHALPPLLFAPEGKYASHPVCVATDFFLFYRLTYNFNCCELELVAHLRIEEGF